MTWERAIKIICDFACFIGMFAAIIAKNYAAATMFTTFLIYSEIRELRQ